MISIKNGIVNLVSAVNIPMEDLCNYELCIHSILKKGNEPFPGWTSIKKTAITF